MEASLRHFVQYEMDGNSSVAAIAESLVANERLVKEATLLFEALVPGLIIESATVSVRRVVQESPLQQAFVVALVAAFQPRLERDVPQIITDLTGAVVPDQYHTLLTILVMLVAVYGISKAIELLFPGRSKDEIDKNYRNLVVVASDLIQTPPNVVDTAVRARYSGKKLTQVTSFARGFSRPQQGAPTHKF